MSFFATNLLLACKAGLKVEHSRHFGMRTCSGGPASSAIVAVAAIEIRSVTLLACNDNLVGPPHFIGMFMHEQRFNLSLVVACWTVDQPLFGSPKAH